MSEPQPAPRKKKPLWPWLLAVVALALTCVGGFTLYMFVPYEPGPWHQSWSATVTHEGHTATYSGFGLGRCGDDASERGASVAKRNAMQMACANAHLCSGDSVCDCSASAEVRYQCEEGQTPGRTRIGDMIDVPIH